MSQNRKKLKSPYPYLPGIRYLMLHFRRSIQRSKRRKTEIETKSKQFVNNKNSNAHLIDKDLLALMSGIPEPISGLPEAKRAMHLRDEEIIYNIYIEKLKRLQAQFIEEARKYALNEQDAAQIRTVV